MTIAELHAAVVKTDCITCVIFYSWHYYYTLHCGVKSNEYYYLHLNNINIMTKIARLSLKSVSLSLERNVCLLYHKLTI